MSKSIWPKADPKRVAAALSGHGALGLAAAALIYILCISGVLSVFNHELQRWEQPGAPAMEKADPAAVQKAAETLLAAQENPTSHFYVQLPTYDLPRMVLTTDAGAVFADEEGGIAEKESHPWTQFVLDLHYYLHVPGTLGLTLVGFLGVILLGLALSGFLAHPRIFRDAFTFRFGRNAQLTQADIHNRLSVWTSPFLISSALTGAMLGLAGVVSGVIAAVEYEGDIAAVYAPVFGDEPEENERPAPLADIAAALHYVEMQYPHTDPVYVIMHEPQTAGQHLQILAEHPERLIFGDYYNFDAGGAFVENVGMADGHIGQQVAASAYRLHFGSFGGMPIKAAYALFGLALAAIIAAGMNIYFLKRRERARAAPRLEAMWTAVVWGAPAALALTLVLSVTGLASGRALVTAFWAPLSLLTLAAAVSADKTATAIACRVAAGGLTAGGVALHGLAQASAFSAPAVFGVNIAGGAFAVMLIAPDAARFANRLRRSERQRAPAAPAE
ncbi:MAG: PepSY-associated TM helix domain-containing protein [Pseudomonadota bacterium]